MLSLGVYMPVVCECVSYVCEVRSVLGAMKILVDP